MNEVMQKPSVIRAGEGMTADLGNHRGTIKISPVQTGASILFSECVADFDGGVPPHIHYNEDEIFYILSGRIEFMIGSAIIEASMGDTIYGPCNIPHAWRVVSPDGARMLVTMTPGANFEQFGMAMARLGFDPIDAMNDPAKAAAFVALAASHGIDMLPIK
jgi:mannose-6-phosphate isomerase-like protein (cupin superfamily)